MTICVNWKNPYRNRAGKWLKGNLHTHTSPASHCARAPLPAMLRAYERRGYDFLSVSDHLSLTAAESARLVLLPGTEWNSTHGEHAGAYSLDPAIIRRATKTRTQVGLLKMLKREEGLAVLNHPNWQSTPHYRREALDKKWPFDGIEIYNGVIERLSGYAVSTDKWDYLLEKGRRVLGFASDDSHNESDVAKGWIMVRSPSSAAKDIFRAIRQGNFYCSSGVNFIDIKRSGRTIRVQSTNAQEIRMVATGGRHIARVKGRQACFRLPKADTLYLRFEAHGPGAAMAWTQPFFLE